MKTSLHFEGPADLSVGEIRITGADGFSREWVATPADRSMTADVQPGYYVAEVTPAGVKAQSVVFQVHRGMANTIALPDFAALRVTGDGTSFLDVDDRASAMAALGNRPGASVEMEALGSAVATAAAAPRLLSIAIAMERAGRRESWAAFDGASSAQLGGGGLALQLSPPRDWAPSSRRRARLSIAIEGVRVERLLLPLYAGGTTVNVTPSALVPNDVTLEVIPVDPNLRAIWRALEAGTNEHAEAVRDGILAIKAQGPGAVLDVVDPWASMLAGLLFIRFPQVFGTISPDWGEALCRLHPWAADPFIILARQVADRAIDAPEKLLECAVRTVDLLARAQACGSPYFSQSNQVFNELVDALVDIEGLPEPARKRLDKARVRWQRELPLQRSAGVSFSWLSRDPSRLKDGILAPKRDVSGVLPGGRATIVFKGRIQAGTIAIETSTCTAPKTEATPSRSADTPPSPMSPAGGPPDCPALRRSPGPVDDPNKGRFGGRPSTSGFSLVAAFPDSPEEVERRGFATILLAVQADADAATGLDDVAWFRLHPTFNPDWVKVFFRGRRADLALTSYGGFTVGVWLPSRGVELELDLAVLDDAPRIVREL